MLNVSPCDRYTSLILGLPIVPVWFHDLLIRNPVALKDYGIFIERQLRAKSMGQQDLLLDLSYELNAVCLAPVNPENFLQIQLAIAFDFGVLARLKLELHRLDGSPDDIWDKRKDPPRGPLISLDLPLIGFDANGPTALLIRQRQRMSWGFLSSAADTAYVPIPALNTNIVQRTLDVARLRELLRGEKPAAARAP